LQLHAAHTGKAYIKQKTAWYIGSYHFQKFIGGIESLDPEAHGTKEIAKSIAKSLVIVNDEDERLRFSSFGDHDAGF